MQNIINPIIIICCLLLYSCANNVKQDNYTQSTSNLIKKILPKIYQPNLIQGSELTLDEVQKIKVGMSKTEIKKILGSPAIIDPFHKKRWDYINQSRVNNKIVKHKLTLFFNNNNQLENAEYYGTLNPNNFNEVLPN